MNIYCVAWEQSGEYNLSAVSIAEDADTALKAVDMYEPENVRVFKIGVADPGIRAQLICKESL